MERIMQESSELGSYQPYVCRVAEQVLYECLDIAAASTLSHTTSNLPTLNSSYTDVATDIVNIIEHTSIAFDLSTTVSRGTDTNLWGQLEACANPEGVTKLVGDGVVNGFDAWALLAYQFMVQPYNTLPRTPQLVTTVAGRSDTKDRCVNLQEYQSTPTRLQWQRAIAVDGCALQAQNGLPPPSPPGARRALATQQYTTEIQQLTGDSISQEFIDFTFDGLNNRRRELGIRAYRIIATDMGAWYLLNIPGVHLSLDLTLYGADNTVAIPISNKEAPKLNADPRSTIPEIPLNYELRFKRHREYNGFSTDACAPIEAAAFASTAMYRGVVSIGQRFEGKELVCGFDIYVWVPAPTVGRSAAITSSYGMCDFAVMAGSSSMDGHTGTVQQLTACAHTFSGSIPTIGGSTHGSDHTHDASPPSLPPSPSPPGHHHHPHDHDEDNNRRSPMYWVVPLLVLLGAVTLCVWPRARMMCLRVRTEKDTTSRVRVVHAPEKPTEVVHVEALPVKPVVVLTSTEVRVPTRVARGTGNTPRGTRTVVRTPVNAV
jgi:hypothetical protein